MYLFDLRKYVFCILLIILMNPAIHAVAAVDAGGGGSSGSGSGSGSGSQDNPDIDPQPTTQQTSQATEMVSAFNQDAADMADMELESDGYQEYLDETLAEAGQADEIASDSAEVSSQDFSDTYFAKVYGDPIRLHDGAMTLRHSDLVLNLPQPFAGFSLERYYDSAYSGWGYFGYGWRSTLEQRLIHRQTGQPQISSPPYNAADIAALESAYESRLQEYEELASDLNQFPELLEDVQLAAVAAEDAYHRAHESMSTALAAYAAADTTAATAPDTSSPINLPDALPSITGNTQAIVMEQGMYPRLYTGDSLTGMEVANTQLESLDFTGSTWLRRLPDNIHEYYDANGAFLRRERFDTTIISMTYNTQELPASTHIYPDYVLRLEWDTASAQALIAGIREGPDDNAPLTRFEYQWIQPDGTPSVAASNGRFPDSAIPLLSRVTYPDGSERTYEYSIDTGGIALTALTEIDDSYITWDYRDGRYFGSVTSDGYSETFRELGPERSWKYENSDGLQQEIQLSDDGKTHEIRSEGTTLSYYYDLLGRTQQIDSGTQFGSTQSTRFTYSANNQLTRIVRGTATLSRSYDSSGRLTRITDADGVSQDFTYDSRGNLSGIYYADGSHTDFEYDSQDRLIREWDEESRSKTFRYDSRGYIESIIDAGGVQHSFAYDSRGNTTSVTRQDGYVITRNIDRFGIESSNQSLIERSERTIQAETPGVFLEGYTISKTPGGRIESLTDPEGNQISYSYNSRGWVSMASFPDGSYLNYRYDRSGLLLSIESKWEGTTTYTHDSSGRVILIETPQGNSTEYIRDNLGRIEAAIHRDASHAITHQVEYGWNTQDQMLWMKDSAGGLIECIYQDGEISHYLLNGEKYVDIDPSTGTAVFPDTQTPLFSNASPKDLEEQAYPSGLIQSLGFWSDRLQYSRNYSWDSRGNLTREIGPEGIQWEYRYDSMNRLVSRKNSLGHSEEFVWENGRLAARHIIGKGSIAYAYDPWGRISDIQPDDGTPACHYSYDSSGRLIAAVNSISAIALRYDEGNRLIEYADNSQDQMFTYQYDSDGEIEHILSNTIEISYRTYARGRPESVEVRDVETHQTLLFHPEYQPQRKEDDNYNDDGRLTRYYQDTSTVQLTYDAAGRLESYREGGVFAEYDYNNEYGLPLSNANLQLELSAQGNLAALLDEATILNCSYNILGEVTAFRIETNAEIETISVAYDALGRPVAMERISNHREALTRILSYSDLSKHPFSQRVISGVTRNTAIANEQGVLHSTSLDILNQVYEPIIAENSNIRGNWNTSNVRQNTVVEDAIDVFFIYAAGLPAALYVVDSGASGLYEIGADRFGNSRAIFNESTATEYSYSPFGVRTIEESVRGVELPPGLLVPGFGGNLYDADTGLTWIGTRWYAPSAGRFLSADPQRSGISWYAYCDYDPINYYDSNGLTRRGFISFDRAAERFSGFIYDEDSDNLDTLTIIDIHTTNNVRERAYPTLTGVDTDPAIINSISISGVEAAPYIPQQFPEGAFSVTTVVEKNSDVFGKYFIATDASQEVPVWEKNERNKWVQLTTEDGEAFTQSDYGYGFHAGGYSQPNPNIPIAENNNPEDNTYGCGRHSSADNIYLGELFKQILEGGGEIDGCAY